jgi:hypothetical protein
VTQTNSITGRQTDRRVVRRLGATLGVLALLVQCLVFAFHRPAQAAPLSPFQDPAAWCFSVSADGPAGPDQNTAPTPHQGAMVCPICQTLHAAGAVVLPPDFTLVAPLLSSSVVLPPATAPPLASRDRLTSQPRAPPTLV